MSLSKKEIHRLVDALPDRETQTVGRFIEFVLMQSHAQGDVSQQPDLTPHQAAPILELTARRVRQLIREGVIPAHKDGSRWLIKAQDLQELATPEARAFLSHPLEKADLTVEEKARSEGAWDRHRAGDSVPLEDMIGTYRHEPPKMLRSSDPT